MSSKWKFGFKKTEIGIIPEDWEIVNLKTACSKIGSGITPRGAEKVYKEEGVALIRSQNVQNNFFIKEGLVYIDESIAEEMVNVTVQENDILLNITGDSVARCCIVPKKVLPARVNQHVCIMRVKPEFLKPKFLQSFMTTNKMQNFMLSLAQSGGTRNALTKAMIESFIVPKPSLTEQKLISEIFENLDSKIELNHQINQTFEVIGQTTFKNWFVDFEFPNEKGKQYKSSGGEMVDSELGEIPKGWKVKSIDEIADFLNGLALQNYPSESEDKYLPAIKIKELRQGITDSSDKASVNIPNEYIVKDGDVLFSWSGSLEVVIWAHGKGALNQHLFKVTSKEYPKWFYYYWIKQHLPEYRHIAEGKATTMGHIQRHHLKSSLVLVPDNETLLIMNKILSPIFEKNVIVNIENRNLSQIRDSLLPKLISGQIRVPIEVKK